MLVTAPLLVGVASALLSGEIKGLLVRSARDAVRAAAALLPESEAIVRTEEWEAHIHDLADEPIRAYVHAKRLRHVAIQIAEELAAVGECATEKKSSLSKRHYAVYELAGGRCFVCGREGLAYKFIVTVAHGGARTLQNSQTLCVECHRRKSELT